MLNRFFRIDYSKEDNVYKCIRLQEATYKGEIAVSFICSWLERNFYDELCFVINQEVDSVDLLKELKEQNAYAISEKAYKETIANALQEIKHMYVSNDDDQEPKLKNKKDEFTNFKLKLMSDVASAYEMKDFLTKLSSLLTPEEDYRLALIPQISRVLDVRRH